MAAFFVLLASVTTFRKSERLCSKTRIERLFSGGKSVNLGYIKFIFLPLDVQQSFPAQVLFSVPKRKVKSAVKRNRLKRQLKEAYRAYKTVFYQDLEELHASVDVAVIYLGREVTDYWSIDDKMEKGLKEVIKNLKNSNLTRINSE